jgi:hypothetical protein
MVSPLRGKKAQHVIFIGSLLLFIFFLAITFFFEDIDYSSGASRQRYDLVQRDASRASASLLLPGYPADWDETSLERLGLALEGSDRISTEKLQALALIDAQADGYARIKAALGVGSDLLIIVEEAGSPLRSYGDPTVATEQEVEDLEPRYLAIQRRSATGQDGKRVALTVIAFART